LAKAPEATDRFQIPPVKAASDKRQFPQFGLREDRPHQGIRRRVRAAGTFRPLHLQPAEDLKTRKDIDLPRFAQEKPL